jgi:hypothetical protein
MLLLFGAAEVINLIGKTAYHAERGADAAAEATAQTEIVVQQIRAGAAAQIELNTELQLVREDDPPGRDKFLKTKFLFRFLR